MALEFADEQSGTDTKSFADVLSPSTKNNSNGGETRRQQSLEVIDEEEEGCYIKDSLAMNQEESKVSAWLKDSDHVVYRGRHYCGNKKFVQNFNKLFKARYIPFLEHPLVHQSEIIDLELAEEMME